MMHMFITEIPIIICMLFITFIGFLYKKKMNTSIVLILSAILLFFCLDKNLSIPMFIYTDHELIIKIILFTCSFLFYNFFYEYDLNRQIFAVLAIICACISISSSNFISLIISMDFATVFICISQYQNKSLSKTCVVYTVMASAFLIAAAVIIYALLGTTSFNDIQYILSFSHLNNPFMLLATLLVLASFCIKFGAFPLHHLILEHINETFSDLWVVLCVFRCSAILIFHKIITTVFYNIDISFIMLLLGFGSIMFASVLVSIQTNIKKIFLYAIIYNSGIAILSSLGNGYSSRAAIIFLIISEITTLLGLFGLVNIIKKNKNKKLEVLDDLRGLSKWNPILAITLSFLVLSLFGTPPFIGFWSKFYTSLFLLQKKFILSAGLIIISMLITMVCMIKILIAIWIEPSENNVYFINLEKTKISISCIIVIITFISIPIANKIVSSMMMEV